MLWALQSGEPFPDRLSSLNLITALRAGTFALMQTVGQSLAIGGTEIYSDPPHCYRGNGFALGACVVGIIATIGLLFHLRAKNAHKLRNQNTEEAARVRALGIEEVWDDHPDFFYVL